MNNDSSERILAALSQAWEELGRPVDFDAIQAIVSKELEVQFQDGDRDVISGFLKIIVDEEIDRQSPPGGNG